VIGCVRHNRIGLRIRELTGIDRVSRIEDLLLIMFILLIPVNSSLFNPQSAIPQCVIALTSHRIISAGNIDPSMQTRL
jgi:sorbitol-specific phosphotransferase system component IIBC